MSVDPTRHPVRDSARIAALAGLAVLCCAGPALLAAGALGVLGSRNRGTPDAVPPAPTRLANRPRTPHITDRQEHSGV